MYTIVYTKLVLFYTQDGFEYGWEGVFHVEQWGRNGAGDVWKRRDESRRHCVGEATFMRSGLFHFWVGCCWCAKLFLKKFYDI